MKVPVLIFTGVYSRHMIVWLAYSQTHCLGDRWWKMTWTFFGGVLKVLVPDNPTPVVTDADPVNPSLSVG